MNRIGPAGRRGLTAAASLVAAATTRVLPIGPGDPVSF